jgi:hypothetical protein
MNERIKQLAEQASDKWLGGEFFDREKFAELIVRECAKVANENVGAFTPGCGNSVLEHFGFEGVEE